jgi:hypothetical protein
VFSWPNPKRESREKEVAHRLARLRVDEAAARVYIRAVNTLMKQ